MQEEELSSDETFDLDTSSEEEELDSDEEEFKKNEKEELNTLFIYLFENEVIDDFFDKINMQDNFIEWFNDNPELDKKITDVDLIDTVVSNQDDDELEFLEETFLALDINIDDVRSFVFLNKKFIQDQEDIQDEIDDAPEKFDAKYIDDNINAIDKNFGSRFDAVRSQFKILGLQYHPTNHPEDPDKWGEKFDKLMNSYNLLNEFNK